MSVCVVGSVALDDIKTPQGERKNLLGGAALHFSNAASPLTQVNLVGVVGDDFPDDGIKLFKEKKVDYSGLEVISGGKTFHWSGYYENDMNTAYTVSTELGVFADFNPKIPDKFKKSKLLFLANIDPVLQLKVKKIMGDIFTMLDTMNFWIDSKRNELMEIIRLVDILLVNEGEARQLTGKKNLIEAAETLLSFGPKYVIIKKGEYGVSIMGKDFYFSLPSFPVTNLVDPTGAGDSFAGGFIGYLASAGKMNKDSLKVALAYGTVIASFYVEGFGVEGFRNVKESEIKKRLAKFRKMITLPDNS